MKIIESFKEDINNSLKEIQENTGKQVEALKEETNKSLKEIQENINVNYLNKMVQDLKMEIDTHTKMTNRGNPGDGKPKKENRNYRGTHH